MARIMSGIMSVFVLVPAIAPSIGQGVIMVLPWRYTFVVLLAMAVIAATWFAIRQPETLAPENRRALSAGNLAAGCIEVLSIRTVLGYTLAMGFIFGAFLSYLGAARQVFQDTLNAGDLFAIYFGVAALAIGAASLLNAMLVMRLGMRLLAHSALVALVVLSGVFVVVFHGVDGQPSISLFMSWQLPAFFCVGILFGNLNALSMEPLGHIAGLGAALIGSISTLVALPLGWLIGWMYDGTVLPLVGGFFLLGLGALIGARWAERTSLFRLTR
jgi:DHA1 family bicyclomycin/chloramphenicol resistance-like MFS transporter